jgi:hypothetical protein
MCARAGTDWADSRLQKKGKNLQEKTPTDPEADWDHGGSLDPIP